MNRPTLNFMDIQTPKNVWVELLAKNPIDKEEIFLEPFAGCNSLYDLVDTYKKDWCEITKDRDIFDYNFENSDVTCLYTNPPYVCNIPDKKGNFKSRNAIYFFLEFFMKKLTHLKRIGFIMNMKCFNSITPKRLKKLNDLGFTISSITMFNCNYWFGLHLFVVFDRNSNDCFKYIEKTFTEKYLDGV